MCDEKSEAAKAGFANICEIGKERIRCVGRTLLEEVSSGIGRLDGVGYGMGIDNLEEYSKATGDMILDTGFRVFKLDSSNLQTWDATPVDELRIEDLLNRMNTVVNRVKADRSDLDMVYEVMLKPGVPLTYSVNQVAVNGKAAYTVGDDCLLLVSLAIGITLEDVEAMADYVPAKVIISRDSFDSDTAMANAYYILRDRGIERHIISSQRVSLYDDRPEAICSRAVLLFFKDEIKCKKFFLQSFGIGIIGIRNIELLSL